MSRPAVITGGTAGIGREFCEQLAARGHDLLIMARDASRLAAVREELEGRYRIRVETCRADLSEEREIVSLAARLAAGEPPGLLVNNAGFGSRGTLAEADPELQSAMVRLHALAPLRLMMAVLPGMVRRGSGAVVNVSSVAGFLYSPGNANYCATKAYLTTVSEGAAAELRGTGVQVQALCPGFTHTEFHDRMRVSKKGLPAGAWLTSRPVVRASLRSLDRRGPVVCIPGLGYRLLVPLIRVTPRRVLGLATALRRARDM